MIGDLRGRTQGGGCVRQAAGVPTSDRFEANELRRITDSHQVIGGRRWRRTDPGLGESVRQQLVDELMDARRAVKDALGRADELALAAARARVDDAKVGLGERGPKWWDDMELADVELRCEAARRALARRTGTTLDLADTAELLRLTR